MQGLQSTVDRFNACHPVGTLVRYWKGVRGERKPSGVTRTVTRAFVLSGHTPVVWVEGETGCVALTHLVAIRQV